MLASLGFMGLCHKNSRFTLLDAPISSRWIILLRAVATVCPGCVCAALVLVHVDTRDGVMRPTRCVRMCSL
jgi:hypothetical protein